MLAAYSNIIIILLLLYYIIIIFIIYILYYYIIIIMIIIFYNNIYFCNKIIYVESDTFHLSDCATLLAPSTKHVPKTR
jgi:hypothetical protein